MYVMLPYAAALLPIAFMLADVYRIARYQKPMTLKQYDHSVLQLKAVTVATLTLSAVSAVGDIVYLLFFCAITTLRASFFIWGACIGIIAVSIALLIYPAQNMLPRELNMANYRLRFHLYCSFRRLFPVSHYLYTLYRLTFRRFYVKMNSIIYSYFYNRTLRCDSGCSVAPFYLNMS